MKWEVMISREKELLKVSPLSFLETTLHKRKKGRERRGMESTFAVAEDKRGTRT